MNQIKSLTTVSLLVGLMISLSACGAKRFSSDMSSNGNAGLGTPNPGGGDPNPGGKDPNPDDGDHNPGDGGNDLLTKDQCFLIYDELALNSLYDLNNVEFTDEDTCKQIMRFSAQMNFGAVDAYSYSLYHLKPTQTIALISQVTGVASPTTSTVNGMDVKAFKKALIASSNAPFFHLVGLYDEF